MSRPQISPRLNFLFAQFSKQIFASVPFAYRRRLNDMNLVVSLLIVKEKFVGAEKMCHTPFDMPWWMARTVRLIMAGNKSRRNEKLSTAHRVQKACIVAIAIHSTRNQRSFCGRGQFSLMGAVESADKINFRVYERFKYVMKIAQLGDCRVSKWNYSLIFIYFACRWLTFFRKLNNCAHSAKTERKKA